VQNLVGSLTTGVWRAQFLGRTNWFYTLERTSDFNYGSSLGHQQKALMVSVLSDTDVPMSNAFYRIPCQSALSAFTLSIYGNQEDLPQKVPMSRPRAIESKRGLLAYLRTGPQRMTNGESPLLGAILSEAGWHYETGRGVKAPMLPTIKAAITELEQQAASEPTAIAPNGKTFMPRPEQEE